MLWEEFRSLALPLLGEHFPSELIEDNGDSIVFTSRRDYTSYVLTEDERGIVIAFEGERNTVVPFCITKSPELAATCLTLLARDGIATLTDMSYTPRDSLGPPSRARHSPFRRSPHRSSNSPRLSIPQYPRNVDHSHALGLSPRPRPPPGIRWSRRIEAARSAHPGGATIT